MSQVIGIGETVLDIVFDHEQRPLSAKPGGSVYNAMISVARAGHNAAMITETGDDAVGDIIRKFLSDNKVEASLVTVNKGCQSHLALAFLDEQKKANYEFYKDYKSQRISFAMPSFRQGDILLFGSYFAINPGLRQEVKPVIETARSEGALLFYDVNFRATHKAEAKELWPTIEENMRMAHIVKGSDEDIELMLGMSDWRRAYHDIIAPLCPYFICTEGASGATLITPDGEHHVAGQKITPVSTIGAGDSFNAGTVCGLLEASITSADISSPKFAESLAQAMHKGVEFATEVCLSLDNYIAKR